MTTKIQKPTIEIPASEKRAQVILTKAKLALDYTEAKTMESRFMEACSYFEAMSVIKEYVKIVRI